MNRPLLILAGTLLASTASATTYTYSSPNYATVSNYTSCTAGPCANYATSMNVNGSFSTATPLAANLALADISAQVTAYSFTDGINTYTSASSNARIFEFEIATGASGQITSASVILELWQSGSSPHSSGNRLSLMGIVPMESIGDNNWICTTVGNATVSGVADACNATSDDTGSSTASESSPGTWSIAQSVTVPTLGKPGTMSLAVLLILCAWYSLRRRGDAAGRA